MPDDTPVTTPLELTVATPVLADTHGLLVAAVPEPVNVVVLPTQTTAVPVMVTATGSVKVTTLVETLPDADFT